MWFFSTLLFSALHVPHVIFGLPMVLHGLWDSSLFLNVAAGREPSPVQFAVYPLAIACAIGMALHGRKARKSKA